MDPSWIERYGYWAVLLGVMLEGETVLILAGYGISRGYLAPLPALLLGALGGAAVDFLYYSIGRRHGPALIGRVHPYEVWIMLALIALGAVIWGVREWRLYHSDPAEGEN